MAATNFTVDIHDEMVQAMVDRVLLAVSPPMLEQFLEGDAHDYFAQQIEMRFAYEGDAASGDWARLTEATEHIREQQGFMGDGPINERTGGLLHFLTENLDVSQIEGGAEMLIPGNASGDLEQKLRHAQSGVSVGENPLFPNSSTPPRPVLAVDEMDLMAVLELLQLHIARYVGVPV